MRVMFEIRTIENFTLQCERRTLGGGCPPTGCSLRAHARPRQLEGAFSVCLNECFSHSSLLPKDRLSYNECGLVAPHRYEIEARHRMVNGHGSESRAICVRGAEELGIKVTAARFNDKTNDAFEEF